MVNLSKEERIKKINLNKEVVVSLVKEIEILNNQKAHVGLVLDYSGSMHRLYQNNTVQDIIERIVPLAMQFDDNNEMKLWLFNDKFYRAGVVNLNNFYNLIENKIINNYDMGGTLYAPVISDIVSYYIKENKDNLPIYIIFVTDGDSHDHNLTEDMIKGASRFPIFWQFIGIGEENFNFLEKLDILEGRYVDNANFFKIEDISNISDENLYKKLLKEFPKWLKYSKVKNMIKVRKVQTFFRSYLKENDKEPMNGVIYYE